MKNPNTRAHGFFIRSRLLSLLFILLMPHGVASAQDGAKLQSTEDLSASALSSVVEDLDVPFGPIVALSPGTDTSLGMRWEPTIAVDPNNPQIVAVAQGSTVQISIDSGSSFNQTIAGSTPMTCDDGTTPCFNNAGCGGSARVSAIPASVRTARPTATSLRTATGSPARPRAATC